MLKHFLLDKIVKGLFKLIYKNYSTILKLNWNINLLKYAKIIEIYNANDILDFGR